MFSNELRNEMGEQGDQNVTFMFHKAVMLCYVSDCGLFVGIMVFLKTDS